MILAERAVLGTILKEPYLIKETDLQPEHFTGGENRFIFQTMQQLEREGKNIDFISLISKASADLIGGANNITEMQRLSNPEKFDDYEEIILDRWRETQKQNVLTVGASENWSIEKIQGELQKLAVGKVSDYVSLSELLLESYESPWKVQENILGVPTGIESIDRITGGLQDTDLIIIAARPSMGKTDVMLKFAKEAGFAGFHPLIFSLEMPARKLRDRLVASVARIDRGKLKNLERLLTSEEKARWKPASDKLATAKIDIFDASAQTVAEIRTKTRKAISERPGLKPVIFVDYLQIMKPSQNFDGNRNLQVSDISGGLKGIAKEFNCPVVCLSQLSRDVEKRPDKRPMLSDLRDSGSIEQDADIIAFPYRDAYYTKNDDDANAEFILGKHRNGDTGTISLTYDKRTGEFE